MADVASRLNATLEGRYRIERELGAGGMATVYLARDLRHNRNVALKVLKPEIAAVVGAERFLAEIETTANLQHPHILPLFDSGEADGFLFYVMPYVEGESLRDRLGREQQLPVEDAVRIATAVANALQAAHDRGVIHRDIKPANILLGGGEALVADFGIALAVGTAGGVRLTETGLGIGTPNYMSPEQAMGEPNIGPATDIFALGCVLHEMLVGRPPFEGTTPQAILGRIIAGEPDSITGRRTSVPAHVGAVVARALERVPADRFASAREMAAALADPSFRHGDHAGRMGGEGSRAWKAAALVLGAAAVLFATLAGFAWNRPREPAPVVRYVQSFRAGEEVSDVVGVTLALSPDGERLVYPGPGNQLWVRERDQLSGSPIPGTDDGMQPFFSPDGRQVAFVTERLELEVASFTGGPTRRLHSDIYPVGGTWGADGYVYFTTQTHLGIVRMPADGSAEPEAVTSLDADRRETWHGWPDLLPDGKGLLLSVERATGPNDIVVVDLETRARRVLTQGRTPRYALSGHLISVSEDGTLAATPFDSDALELTPPAVPVVEGVAPAGQASTPLAISREGRLVYLRGAGETRRQVVWVDREGNETSLAPDWVGATYLAVSPEGSRLAAQSGSHIWIRHLDDGELYQLTFEGERNWRPAWSPDGRYVTFTSERGDDFALYWKRADGSVPAELLADHDRPIQEGFLSPDGESFVLRLGQSLGDRDLYAMRRGGDGVTPLVTTSANERAADLSPDGRWLAYVSDETGRDEVYVRPFPNAQERVWQISTEGGIEPLWANSGRELFYLNRSNQLVAVTVTTEPGFLPGRQDVLFSTSRYLRDLNHRHYDVSSDDSRFVMVRRRVFGPDDQLIVVENFFEELERLVPR